MNFIQEYVFKFYIILYYCRPEDDDISPKRVGGFAFMDV